MSKFYTIYLVFQIIVINCVAQEVSFEFYDTQDRSQMSTFCVQNVDQHYLLTSYTVPNDESEYYKAKIFELDANGVLINTNEYEVANSDLRVRSLIEQTDHYIGIGGINNLQSDSNFLWYAKIDFDLNIIEQRIIYLDNLDLGSIQSTVIGDIIFCVGHGTNDYAFKLTLDGDLLGLNADLDGINFKGINSMIPNNDNNSLLLFGYNIVELDLNLNVLDVVEPRPFELRPDGYVLAHTDSTYILCGKKHYWDTTQERDIGIGISNFEYEELEFKTFGGVEKIDFPAWNKSLAKNDFNEIYCGGTLNIFTDSTEFVLAKFDSQLNKIWEYPYKTNHRSEMMGLITTADNGCLMYGFSVESTLDGALHSIYVVKVDDDGIVGIDTSIPISISYVDVYPNPATNFLNIELSEQGRNTFLEIRSINGETIYSELLNGERTQIDVQDYPDASYLISLKDEKGKLIGNQKFVKQSTN